jgi:hypothetical protein
MEITLETMYPNAGNRSGSLRAVSYRPHWLVICPKQAKNEQAARNTPQFIVNQPTELSESVCSDRYLVAPRNSIK